MQLFSIRNDMNPLILLLIGITSLVTCSSDDDWWTHGVFYQIYPRSFRDDDNDGIGDLKGINNRLKHLKDLGITATWLSPIYSSPQVDQGYDISNFTEISPEYGTMKEFEELIEEGKQLGIKIIMDFVPNHSSDLHEWFSKSENKEPGYEDFYIWREGLNNNTQPPNNWLSVFGGSAWEYSPKRQEWYLHQFTIQQPDLNYRSARLVQEMKNVLTFWLDKGVAGFRVDAIPFLFEDPSFANESLSNNPVSSPLDWAYLNHTLTLDLNETYDMVYQWRELLDEYTKNHPEGGTRFMTTEAYTDVPHTMLYYGNGSRNGAHFTFNFYLIQDLNINSSAHDVEAAVRKFADNLPKEYVPNWVLGNHDNHRFTTRLGPENADNYNMLSLLLPGTAVSYNGDEIGQEDGEVTYEEGKDPSACKFPERFNELSRDFERTPFQWDDTVNAGFNDGTKPWLPVSKKYKETNLMLQKNATKSHYKIYKALVKLRKLDEFANGHLAMRALNPDVLVFERSTRWRSYYVILNIGKTEHKIKLPERERRLKVVLSSLKSRKNPGALYSSKNIHLDPHEGFVALSVHR